MNKKIAILGCGWLGLPLGRRLVEKGWSVSGSTTSPERFDALSAAGIEPYHIDLQPGKVIGNVAAFLQDAAVLFLNIPPGLRRSSKVDFVGKIKALLPSIHRSSLEEVIFISSTSVYGSLEGEVHENTPPAPDTESGKQLLETETMLRKELQIPCTIIRYGGLIGPDRHPVTFLSGRSGLSGGGAPVNLIHQEDAVNIPIFLLDNAHSGVLCNAVAPEHPEKHTYYAEEASKRNIAPPGYTSAREGTSMKRVSSHTLKALGYHFTTSISS